MAKRYFSTKQESSLPKILLGVCVALAIFYGISKVFWGGTNNGDSASPLAQDSSQPLAEAHLRIVEGDWKGARELLNPLMKNVDAHADAPRILLLMAEVEQAEGNVKTALEILESAYAKYLSSQHFPEIAANYAYLLESNGQEPQALQIYNELLDSAPPEAHVPALMGMARTAEREDKLVEARDLFRKALTQSKWGSSEWNQALDKLGELNVKLIFSPMETPESKKYAVEAGDNLTSIGIKLNTTQGLLMIANNIDDPAKLRLGQRLKYTPKDFRIIVERSTCTLYLCDKEGIFKRYKTGLGMPGHETTLGTYMLGNKQKDPTWFKPGFGPIEPGHPDNELGTRWMPLVPTAEGLPTDLGIHGTIDPPSIGLYKSHGCPRMHNADVEELYDIVVRSTPVEIVDKVDMDTIMKPQIPVEVEAQPEGDSETAASVS